MGEPLIQWDEQTPSPDDPINNALIVIAVRLGKNIHQAIGTGFVVGITKEGAAAVGAAHVFEEIYRLQNPREYRPSNPFLTEDPQKIDLDPNKVYAMLFDKGRVHFLKITKLSYDLTCDLAFFRIAKVKEDNRKIFRQAIHFDYVIPPVGAFVEGVGFKGMKFSHEEFNDQIVNVFHHCLTRRVGSVTEVLERTPRFNGPGAIVSFPIFGGMSGGPAMTLRRDDTLAAFGILSSDFEATDEEKHDKFVPGCTTIAKLPIIYRTDSQNRIIASVKFSGDLGTGIGDS